MNPFDRFAKEFGAHQELASRLLPFSIDQASGDGAHDYGHLMRVWSNARRIMEIEGGDREVLVAAVLLHDCVSVEKGSPDRKKASRFAAEKANKLLSDLGWNEPERAAVHHAIEAHSFSAAIEPETLEARILQDADRLDAIGFIGVARCFYIAGRMGSALYDAADVLATERELDDSQFALDHFPRKLFLLSQGFRTPTGDALAQERHRQIKAFYDGFVREVS